MWTPKAALESQALNVRLITSVVLSQRQKVVDGRAEFNCQEVRDSCAVSVVMLKWWQVKAVTSEINSGNLF